jgi:integrase
MARPSKTATIDFSVTHDLTSGLIDRAACPSERAFVLLKDTQKKGLRVRVTKAGGKHWQFETRLRTGLFTRTLGGWPTVSIEDARRQAHYLRGLTEQGIDPRELEAQELASKRLEVERIAKEEAARLKEAAAKSLTVGDIWPAYLKNGNPKRRDSWKPRYLEDLKKMGAAGGLPKQRGKGLTRPGPIYPLMSMALVDIHEDTLKAWHDKEAQTSKYQAERALMMFRGFMRWCATKPEYRNLIDLNAGRAPAILDSLPKTKRRTDALETAQVSEWWAAVESLPNRTISVYLRALLLTGARRLEMASLRWADIDFRWKKLTIGDKVELARTIPLSPHLAQLFKTLPRVNEWVFASGRPLSEAASNVKRRERSHQQMETLAEAPLSKDAGHLTDARSSHETALKRAGIPKLTHHGLRRSFSLLGEAAGAPAGAIAQLMGHKPSAVAEGYRPRSIDALRPYLARIEAHILSLVAGQAAAAEAQGEKADHG